MKHVRIALEIALVLATIGYGFWSWQRIKALETEVQHLRWRSVAQDDVDGLRAKFPPKHWHQDMLESAEEWGKAEPGFPARDERVKAFQTAAKIQEMLEASEHR